MVPDKANFVLCRITLVPVIVIVAFIGAGDGKCHRDGTGHGNFWVVPVPVPVLATAMFVLWRCRRRRRG